MGRRITLYRERDIPLMELCSPPHNRTDKLFFDELGETIDSLQRGNCKGLIVCGRGRHFSSGADMEELLAQLWDGSKLDASASRAVSLLNDLGGLSFPVVAAIEGCCLGSGMELALACHYRIATGNALFSLPETDFGIMPGCGGTSRLPGIIGVGKSIEMILSGRSFLAEDALRINLIDAIVKKSELMACAERLIHTLAGERP